MKGGILFVLLLLLLSSSPAYAPEPVYNNPVVEAAQRRLVAINELKVQSIQKIDAFKDQIQALVNVAQGQLYIDQAWETYTSFELHTRTLVDARASSKDAIRGYLQRRGNAAALADARLAAARAVTDKAAAGSKAGELKTSRTASDAAVVALNNQLNKELLVLDGILSEEDDVIRLISRDGLAEDSGKKRK